MGSRPLRVCFFFNDTATTEIYTLSLHDALPIYRRHRGDGRRRGRRLSGRQRLARRRGARSEEHTSELQSQSNLVCRLLLEKKKTPICTVNKRHNTYGTSTAVPADSPPSHQLHVR